MPREVHELEGQRIDFGKYAGTLWTRLPVPYLRWLSVEGRGSDRITAQHELNRRGVALDEFGVDVSIHAIDRASLKLFGRYRKTRMENEGIYSWLARTGRIALDEGACIGIDKYITGDIVYVIKRKPKGPKIMTVYTSDTPEWGSDRK